MTHVIIMPVWQLLFLVVAVAAGASIPSAAFGARRGARMAIAACSQHWDCNMAKDHQREQTTEDLEKQFAEMRKAHPEIAEVRKAMERADSGPIERTRAKKDEEGQF